MEKTYTKDELRKYIRARLESLTSPVAFAYGYTTRGSAVSQISELRALAGSFQLFDVYEELKTAQEKIQTEIDARIKRGLGASAWL